MSEDVQAKEYWGTTAAQQKEYTRPRFYVTSLVHVIKRLAPRSVLEMGCNSGRNLAMLRDALPASTALRGFDINAESIAFGKAKWGLELEVADEGYLGRLPDGGVDLAFTVSVLDHLPKIDGVLRDLARATRRYYVAVEPFPEEDLRYLDVFKADGRIRKAVTTTTPFSYLHRYDRLAPRAGLRARLDVPMPPYAGNWGPLYRLTVYEKAAPLARLRAVARTAIGGAGGFAAWDQLRDELMFDAVRWNIR